MKTPLLKTLLASSILLATSTIPGAQEDTTFDPLGTQSDLPKLVRVQVEFIDVSHEQFTELLFGPHPSANDDQLRKKVAELTKSGRASVVETMLCTGRSGQKSTSESIEEFIYPTEYEPASMPEKVEFKTAEEAEKSKVTPRDYATGPTPTAFETRNLGSTLEIEPTIGEDGKLIDLRFIPEIVYHVGDITWAEWKDIHGQADIKMPTMYTVRVNTSVTLADGQYTLVAGLSPKGKDGHPDFTRKLMVFVKADVLTVGR